MAEFNDVYLDRIHGTTVVAVEAGARLLDVYEKLYKL